jgi:RpiB/LacA/LacB family sugar-phosphate isomerase
MAYAGMCHSDEHLRTGDMGAPAEVLQVFGVDSMFPMIGGHEGAGVVAEVGPGVETLSVGDHVAASFIPACGRCFWCASGRQYLCDLGMTILAGPMMSDGQWRYHLDGQHVNRMTQLGTFSDSVLANEASLVKVDPAVSLKAAALISCGISTGFGSAVDRAKVKPGETVVVVGCGGVGSGAIQGARLAGARQIIAVDPLPFKVDKAKQIGATHGAASILEANLLLPELTEGRMADVVILTPGVLTGDLLGTGSGAGFQGRAGGGDGHRPLQPGPGQPQSVQLRHVQPGIAGNGVRLVQPAGPDPQSAPPLRGGPARDRRPDHPGVHPRRSPERLRRPGRRYQRARCRQVRSLIRTFPAAASPCIPAKWPNECIGECFGECIVCPHGPGDRLRPCRFRAQRGDHPAPPRRWERSSRYRHVLRGAGGLPAICADVARRVVRGEGELGIVIGGSGQGEAIAANKVHGSRAALCHDEYTARLARRHNDANVLSLGARVVATELALDIVDVFLATGFEGGRHVARIEELAVIEAEESGHGAAAPPAPR